MQPIEALVELERRGATPERFRPLVAELDSQGLLSSRDGRLPAIAGVIELYSRGVLTDTNADGYNADASRQYLPLVRRLVGAGLVTPYIPESQREGALAGMARRAVHGLTAGTIDEIGAGLGALHDASFGGGTNLSEDYDYNLAVQRHQYRQAQRNAGLLGGAAEIVGGFLMPAARLRALGPGATVTERAHQLGTASAAYAAATGFGEGEGGFANRIENAAGHAATGYVVGAGLGAGLARWSDWRAARRARADASALETAAQNQNVANEFAQEGVPAFGPAVSASPTVQATAESMMGSVLGGPLVNSANRTVTGLENRIAETIAGAGGRRAGDEMGQEVQTLLRRNLTEYSAPNAVVNHMTPAEAEAITRVPTGPGYIPPRPRAEPVAPVEVAPVAPRQVTMDEVNVPAVHVPPEPVQTNYRPFESVTLEEINPQLAQRISTARAELTSIERIHNERVLSLAQQAAGRYRRDMNGLFRDLQADPTYAAVLRERRIRNIDDFINHGIAPQRNALGVIDDFRAVRRRYDEIVGRYQEALRPYRESVARYDTMANRIRELEAQGERARDAGWRLMVQNEHGNAVRRAEQATAQRRVAAETSAREAEMRRLQAAEDERAIQETARLRGTARSEAEQAQRARQRELDAKYDADMQGYTPRFQAGASREHTYPTEFAAAYRQAEMNARGPIGHFMAPIHEYVPPAKHEVKVGPLRTGHYQDVEQIPLQHRTATMKLLNDLGREARSQGRLPGWKDFDFGKPSKEVSSPQAEAFWKYIRGRLGNDIAGTLRGGLDRTITGRLPISGLRDIRTEVRRAAEAIPREGVHIGDQAMLRRLHGAMSEDIQTMLRKAGKVDPAYTIAADQYLMIDAAYEHFVVGLRRPLRAVFGENVAPEHALRRLQAAAQTKTQDLQMLRNFYKVATEKGDVKRVTGMLVSNMAEGGLPGFLKQFSGLSPEAKKIMFAGNAGGLGNALERLYRLSKKMEPYIVEGRGVDLTTLTRMSNLSLGGIAFMVNIPAAIGQAIGMHAMARLMASEKFVTWLTQMPKVRTPWTPEFNRQLDRLRSIFIDELGVNDAAWEQMRPNILREIRGRPMDSRAA